eukprot:2138677-Lingulodinium_polyedra.AAC.1
MRHHAHESTPLRYRSSRLHHGQNGGHHERAAGADVRKDTENSGHIPTCQSSRQMVCHSALRTTRSGNT